MHGYIRINQMHLGSALPGGLNTALLLLLLSGTCESGHRAAFHAASPPAIAHHGLAIARPARHVVHTTMQNGGEGEEHCVHERGSRRTHISHMGLILGTALVGSVPVYAERKKKPTGGLAGENPDAAQDLFTAKFQQGINQRTDRLFGCQVWYLWEAWGEEKLCQCVLTFIQVHAHHVGCAYEC